MRSLVALALALVVALGGCHRGAARAAPPALVADKPAVSFHPTQPMVVDLAVKLVHPATLRVEVPADPGVHVGRVVGAGTSLTVRLRGLAPDTDYVARLAVSDAAGGKQTLDVPFKTLAALRGFIPRFKPTVNGKPSDDLRTFDLSKSPAMSHGAIYTIDAQGTTRFYLPRISKETFTEAVPTGIKLLDDGTLLFVQDDRAFRVDELGTVLMDIHAKQLGVATLHHDILQLPSGNYLTIGSIFADYTYAFDHKRHHVAGDALVEFTPSGKVVWTWKTFDHLDPMRVRDGFDPVLPLIDPATHEKSNDWTHSNAILYLPADDSVLLSIRHQDWIIKIDRKSGDVVWKLGEDGDFKLAAGQKWFYHQHAPELEPDGSLLVFDNGAGNPHLPPKDQRARPLRIKIDLQKKTADIVWQENNQKYYAPIAGDVDRLENGDIQVLDSMITLLPNTFQVSYARLREVDPATNKWVWKIDLPDGRFAYRCIHTHRLPGEALAR